MLAVALPAQGVDVRWRGDPRCPEAEFQGSLARYLAEASERRPVEVTAEVRRDGEARWSASLELTTADGRSARTLRGRSCAEVSDAAAFVTAVVVDPGVLTRPAPGAIVPAPAEEEASPAEGDAPEEIVDMTSGPGEMSPRTGSEPAGVGPAVGQDELELSPGTPALEPVAAVGSELSPGPEPRPPAGRRGFVRVAGGLEALGMPGVGPQLGLTTGLLGARWRAELTGMYRAPTTRFTDVDPSAGARVRLWTVGVRGCWVPPTRGVEVPLCGGLEAGQALGEGVGYAGAQADRIPWVAALLGPALAWAPRPWLALWLGVDLALPLRQASFSADGLGTMFESAPVSLRAALGLEIRFGRDNRR